MHSFSNDYSEGAHPKVLELMVQSNFEQNIAYGLDVHSDKARELIRKEIRRSDTEIHFIPGGTQTNLLAISSFLRPHHCVIAAATGHINVHETGAIEATGHKVVAMPGVDGKLTPEAIRTAVETHSDEHMVLPKMVYLSDSTELGTVYTKSELAAIRQICLQYGLILFLDGARLGAALTCKTNDLTLKDIADLTDAFYIGGTKNGALLGEALVLLREDLKADFRYLIKQRGAMPAKGFLLGMQFEALFTGGLYFELARHANRMAERVAEIFRSAGYPFYAPPCTNQVFPIVPDALLQPLCDAFGCQVQAKPDGGHTAVRFVTSWATTEGSTEALEKFLSAHSA